MDALVAAFAVFDDGTGPALYAGGWFTQADGQSASRVAKWNGLQWSPLGGGLDGPVEALAVFDDGSGPALYAGGLFHYAGGVSAERIAKWNGTSWSALGSGCDEQVSALAVFDDGSGPALYAGGYFTNAGGVFCGRIARWDGAAWSAVSPLTGGSSPFVAALCVFPPSGPGSSLYAGGRIDYAGGNPVKNIVRWDGASWSQVGVGLNDVVYALTSFDDGTGLALVAGGAFTTSGPVLIDHVAKWVAGTWRKLGAGLTSALSMSRGVNALVGFGAGASSRLYAGGEFTLAGGNPSKYIAAWGDPCSAPIIVTQPTNQVAVFPDPVAFSVEATGTAVLVYQWRKDGVDLSDQPGYIEGAKTPDLKLYGWSFNDAGEYDVVVSNFIGSTTSMPATLEVPAGGQTGYPVKAFASLLPPVPVSNLPGQSFTSSCCPVLSPTGEVVFLGDLGSGWNLAEWDSAAATMLQQAGQQAPQASPGTTIESFSSHYAEANHQALFTALLAGPGIGSSNNEGIWYRDPTATDAVALEAAPAPGIPGSIFKSMNRPTLSGPGTVAFMSPTYSSSSGAFVDTGIWTWDRSGGLVLEWRGSDPAPGTATNFAGFLAPYVALNGQGDLAAVGRLNTITGYNYTIYKDTGIWLKPKAAALQLVARSGDPAPGFSASDNLELFGEMILNDGGNVLFDVQIAGPNMFKAHGLYAWSPSGPTPVAISGQTAPGADPASSFWAPKAWGFNGTGSVLFYSNLQNVCIDCPSEGLWLRDSSGMHAVMLNRKDPLPQAPPGFEVLQIESAALNDLDHVVVQVKLYNGSAYRAVYGYRSASGLFPIAVPGSQIEVAPGDYRTVQNAYLAEANAGSIPTASSGLSDSDLVLIQLNFTDATTGLFTAHFHALEALHFGPATVFCAGDGSMTACPCGNPGATGKGCANSTGGGALLEAKGTVVVSADDLRFDATGLPPSKMALLFQGPAQMAGGAGVPFRDGLLCIAGAIQRLEITAANPQGHAAFGPGLAAKGTWQGGSTVYFQTWYRDPSGPCATGSNLTNALAVTFVP
jgi:hypothetical protein